MDNVASSQQSNWHKTFSVRQFTVFWTLWTSDGRQNNVVCLQKLINTRRYLDVDSTFFERHGRQVDGKTTLCAYWAHHVCTTAYKVQTKEKEGLQNV